MTLQKVIPLICPDCGWDLTGLATDSLFGCDNCHVAWEPCSEGLAGPYPIRQLDAEGKTVALPFWRFEIKPLLLPEEVPPIPVAYIPAFDMRKRTYFGDPGLSWTVERLWIEAEKPGSSLRGMTLGFADAKRLARFFVLRAIDESFDISDLDLEIELGDPQIIQISFIDSERALIDPLTEKSYPFLVFCDLPVMREGRP